MTDNTETNIELHKHYSLKEVLAQRECDPFRGPEVTELYVPTMFWAEKPEYVVPKRARAFATGWVLVDGDVGTWNPGIGRPHGAPIYLYESWELIYMDLDDIGREIGEGEYVHYGYFYSTKNPRGREEYPFLVVERRGKYIIEDKFPEEDAK